MRPKKIRYFEDIQLAERLYPDPRKRPGYWQYRRADNGKNIVFQADSVKMANAKATEMTALIGSGVTFTKTAPAAKQLELLLLNYFIYNEKQNPKLLKKASWNNRKNALLQFASEFPDASRITFDTILVWWDDLTYHQHKLRRSAFRKAFNYLIQQNACPQLKYNPFTSNDGFICLPRKERQDKERLPILVEAFNQIYMMAGKMGYPGLQIGMEISRYTTLRIGDITRLQTGKHIVGQELRVIISKSEAQKGSARASRLGWGFKEHPALWNLVNRARKLSKANNDCPFLISHKGAVKRHSKAKEHQYQMLTDTLSKQFREVRDVCGFDQAWADTLGDGKTPFSFHEIRGLAITMLSNSGYSDAQIAEVTAHESVTTTQGYQNAESLPYVPVRIKIEGF